ncbi:MAG: hypothetical protein WC326_08400 [Candidatus Delongbacteria bacterium]
MRPRKAREEHVVPLHPSPDTPTTQSQEPAPKPAGKEKGNKLTDTDCKAYDHLSLEVHQLQELTACAGWGRFFGSLMREADEARTQLEFAEKPRDVVKLQATIALVKSQLKKLHQPVEDLNGMRTRWPLFMSELPWRGDFDELTGRVTLIWAGLGEAPGDFHQSLIKSGASTGARPDPSKPAEPADPVVLPATPAATVPGDTVDEDPEEDLDDDENLDPAGGDPEPDDPFGE